MIASDTAQVEERLQKPLAAEFEGIPSADLYYEDKVGGRFHSCAAVN